MLRGTTLFVCRSCGNKFKALDMEWNATVLTAPMPCSQCGSRRTRPIQPIVPAFCADIPYLKIWEKQERGE